MFAQLGDAKDVGMMSRPGNEMGRSLQHTAPHLYFSLEKMALTSSRTQKRDY